MEKPAEVAKLTEVRAKLRELGPRPDGVDVDEARHALLRIDTCLKDQLEANMSAPVPVGQDFQECRVLQVKKAKSLEDAAEEAKVPFQSLLDLDELHILYEEEERQAEIALEAIDNEPSEVVKPAEEAEVPFQSSIDVDELHGLEEVNLGTLPEVIKNVSSKVAEPAEELDTYVSTKLSEALEGHHDALDLSGQYLQHMPESFGRITSLVTLNLSNNCLEIWDALSLLGDEEVRVVAVCYGLDEEVDQTKNLSRLPVRRPVGNFSNKGALCLSALYAHKDKLRLLSITFNLSIQMIPDSLAGLVNLETLDVQHNQLKLLPDSIGLLSNLKYLDASKNGLRTLPASIGRCSQLLELKANFNQLEFWPSDLDFQLINLQTLSLHLNRLTGLPSSIGELRSLKVLDVHFNKLRGLPTTIGNLTNLEVLDISSNFNDLVNVPDTIGDLVSLVELDLSFNQIHELPISIGRLTNLQKLKFDENPLVVPPLEVVEQGHQSVMIYMADLWKESLKADEEKLETANKDVTQQETAEGWIPSWAGGALVSNWFGKVQAGGVASLLGERSWLSQGPQQPKVQEDNYLEQQL